VFGSYDADEEGVSVHLTFGEESEEKLISFALKTYVEDLIEIHGDDGYKLFQKADMRIYMA